MAGRCTKGGGRRAHLIAAAALLCATPAAAQSALERTPNLSGGWVGTGGRLDFHFVHRFNNSGPPQRQVQNRPTFLIAWELPWRTLAGMSYSTRSALAAGVPNEWEPFIRVRPLPRDAGLEVGAQLGYNNAARSMDTELSATRAFGALRPLLALRFLGSDAATGNAALAVAGGAVLRVHQHVALAADAGRRFAGGADGRVFWGAGVQLRIPYSPHTLSLHATNTDALTLQSASRASGATRWGFEFTVPVTPGRYIGRGAAAGAAGEPGAASSERAAEEGQAAEPADVRGDTTVVVVKNLQYGPARVNVRAGQVVQWRNRDPLAHTATAADSSWDSGLVQPDSAWARRFDRPGTYTVVCTPHPFMRMEVIVR